MTDSIPFGEALFLVWRILSSLHGVVSIEGKCIVHATFKLILWNLEEEMCLYLIVCDQNSTYAMHINISELDIY